MIKTYVNSGTDVPEWRKNKGPICCVCGYTDGCVYTSYPPKIKCSITGEFHFATDNCDVEDNETEEEDTLTYKGDLLPNKVYMSYEWADDIKNIGKQLERIADKVNVVHCKDCKWHYLDVEDKSFWCHYVDTDDDDYCSQGEKDVQIH